MELMWISVDLITPSQMGTYYAKRRGKEDILKARYIGGVWFGTGWKSFKKINDVAFWALKKTGK